MRLNAFIALATGWSRRVADQAIIQHRVEVNGIPAHLGQQVTTSDMVRVDGNIIHIPKVHTTILLNKPVGYVCSRRGQGSLTIYSLLPARFQELKPVGRLDKDSSGLLLLTNDGALAQQLTHPSFQKEKRYHIRLNKPLQPHHKRQITEHSVLLEDGPSRFQLQPLKNQANWRVIIKEGRNRQIRRTFQCLGYKVITLHRTDFANYHIGNIPIGSYRLL